MGLEQRICEMGGQGWAWTGPWPDGGPGTKLGGIYICIHNICKAQVQWNTVFDFKKSLTMMTLTFIEKGECILRCSTI